jgi:DNA processing protein
MDRDIVKLAACMACAGNSSELARWLAEPAESCQDLLGPARQRRARIRSSSAERLVNLIRQGAADDASQRLQEQGWQLLDPQHRHWPALLEQIDDAPPLLFVRGSSELLGSPQLAMVGARHASTEGLDNARRFARLLAGAGFTITSGLALGIDGAAHRGALQTGKTLAVLGHGPGPCYPPRHRSLAEDLVAAGGTLVTEFPPGVAPHRAFFPQRNRLISGLSLATLVIEAAEHSGSLITARLAAAQGREVFAVPGSIHNPLSKGCHRLLRDGANWLETVQDVLAVFDSFRHLADTEPAPATSKDPLLRYFRTGANSLDQLHERSGLPLQELAEALATRELSGTIQRVPGGYARRYPDGELS